MGLPNVPGWAVDFITLIRPKLKIIRVAGAAAATNIAVAGIKVSDVPLVAYNETDSKHQDTTGAKANVAMANVGDGKMNTVLEATNIGEAGNLWKVRLISGAALSIQVDQANRTVNITFNAGVSTVTQIEAAVTALAGADDVVGVKTGGTGANVPIAATAGLSAALAGGVNAGQELPAVTSAGNIQFPSAVTTGKNIDVGYYVS